MKIHPPPSLSSHLISSLMAILSGDYRWKAMLEAHGVKVKTSRALIMSMHLYCSMLAIQYTTFCSSQLLAVHAARRVRDGFL